MAKNHLSNQSETFVKKTMPLPVTCESCGFELPNDADRNVNYFVSYLSCRDMNRNNKIFTGQPAIFLEKNVKDKSEKVTGDSAGGYHLKENYSFAHWTVWCCRCHSNKTKLQDMSRKTNNLKATGKTEALSIEGALKKLRGLQNMKSASRNY